MIDRINPSRKSDHFPALAPPEQDPPFDYAVSLRGVILILIVAAIFMAKALVWLATALSKQMGVWG